jgi:assimilatory nitrate reductase catalytic subunit
VDRPERFRALLAKLDFLCVQDLYTDTETARLAHLVLPAAGWGEKEGTFINSERRVARVKKVSRAPGQALSDFAIFRLIADAWGCGELFARWKAPEDVFDSVKELSRGRFCDITGIRDYRMLDETGGVQWPLREGEVLTATERRLFAGGVFAHGDGRARFCFDAPREVPEAPDQEYPFVLLTGRGSSAQWHTETRTKRSPVLAKLHPPEPSWRSTPPTRRSLALRAATA